MSSLKSYRTFIITFTVFFLIGCVPEGSLNSGIYSNVSDETLCWQAENGLEAETRFERMKRFLNCTNTRARPEGLGRVDEQKFQNLPENEKIARSSDVRICAFATENGSWTMQQRWRGYIYEAQRRGLDCGVGRPNSRQLTQNKQPSSKPTVSKPSVPQTQDLGQASDNGAERTIARYETQFGPSDDAESFENNLVMKFCKTGLFVDDFVYLWIRSGSLVTVKKETGSTPGSCSRNYKVVDWNGTVSQGFLVLKANSRPSTGGWDAVAEEFLIQQQNSQQQLNKSLMDSFRNNQPGSIETLERNRAIDCMSRGGAYVGGVCRFN